MLFSVRITIDLICMIASRKPGRKRCYKEEKAEKMGRPVASAPYVSLSTAKVKSSLVTGLN